MAPTIEELEAMSDDEIRAAYNKTAAHTEPEGSCPELLKHGRQAPLVAVLDS